MSDQPKVSERMQSRVADVVEASYRRGLFETHATSDPTLEANDTEATNALLSAIAEIEQRAEKWKEAAVALYQCSRELADIGCKDFALTNNRLDAAFAALGDEWDEAVKGEG